MKEDIKKRDETDYNRKEGPLKQAEDAILIDTSSLTIEGTVDKIIALMQSNPLNNSRLDNKCCSKRNPAMDDRTN
jgi:cytidylate kinase